MCIDRTMDCGMKISTHNLFYVLHKNISCKILLKFTEIPAETYNNLLSMEIDLKFFYTTHKKTDCKTHHIFFI